jgi:phosphopantothenoylcysteine decarboxylase
VNARRVVYLIVCAAPPALAVSDLISAIADRGWTCCVIPTPTAATWLDLGQLERQTGQPVRHELRPPGAAQSLPRADAIVVAPATFNTINKWVTGISDNVALGILNEAIGLELPTVVAPHAKPTLAAHPAFRRNLQSLTDWGIRVLPNEVLRTPGNARTDFHWLPILDALPAG